eukprot:CCRYP_016809-RA/>CCRYP_016809-RA protein AED:0.04 eAED:0.04 QI:91/1/1/1/0/0/2/114/510
MAQEDAAGTSRVIIAYKPTASSAIRKAVAAARGNHGQAGVEMVLADVPVMELPSGKLSAMAVELPTDSLGGLSRDPNVAFIEEDMKRYPHTLSTPSTGNPYAPGQLVPYGIQMVQADLLAGTDASNRKVCIIDSGYNLGHEDLPSDSNIVTGEDMGIAPWAYDTESHGSHVAGTISALNNNGTGVVGVHSNNSLKLHIINVFGTNEYVYDSDVVGAAFRCMYAGANVINLSLGGEDGSKWMSMAFDEIYKSNVLIIASAGNGGDSVINYPAGYSSVVSVAAVDENLTQAFFSTFNNDVELSGPGVDVLSTVVLGMGSISSLVVGSTSYYPGSLLGSPKLSRSGFLADFGLGDKIDNAVLGKVCLIARGIITFNEKVLNCEISGGIAAVIYNNRAGTFYSSVGSDTTIPSLTVSDVDGIALLTQLGQTAVVTVTASNYAYASGTSMAAPHVSAVAALVWARNLKCTAAQIRNSLAKSALDLGKKGRDKYYGFGMVQAKAADDRIKKKGCGK